MKSIKYLFLMMSIIVVLIGCSQTKVSSPIIHQSQVVEIISQMPASNSQHRDELAAKLVALNPQATALLAEMLLSPSDPRDTGARYGLSALTDYVSREGAESERVVYAEALIDALAAVSHKQNKAFLISQLQLAGKNESVEPLATYLNDEFLCDYAARALLTIGTDDVENEFLKALNAVDPVNKPTIIKSLGELQSNAAVKKITPYAMSKDRSTRDIALYALANIGEPSSQKILSDATQTKNAYDRAQYISLYLLFARRQAETGNRDLCVTICNAFIEDSKMPEYIRAAAANTLPSACVQEHGSRIPAGFTSMFNGKDLTDWKRHDGLPNEKEPTGKWTVENGVIVGIQDPPGKGGFLTSTETFRDFELMLETKIDWPFDTGVFLRVGPDGKSHQVTLDYRNGGEIGGIYCPWTQGFVRHCTDGIKQFRKGQWNRLRIICQGEPARIRVWLNDIQITDFQHTEESTAGIPEEGTICLQVHPGGDGYDKSQTRFRNIFIRRFDAEHTVNVLTKQEKADGFVPLFNGRDLAGWTGSVDSYGVNDGVLFCRKGTGRNIYTEKEYDNFILRFEFKLDPGANNGLGIRTPLEGDAAYVGMELQILDDTAEKYSNLHDWQYHGSVYGVIAADPAKRGCLKPVGEWNFEEVIADGTHITVNLNGTTIVEGDIEEASKNGTLSGKEHPGLLNKTGHIGFLGHGDYVEFRNIRLLAL